MKALIAFLACLTGCAVPTKTESFCLPKRITRGLMLAFPLAFAATSSYAEGNLRVDKDCDENAATCQVVGADLFDLIANNNKGWEIAHGLRDKVLELRAKVKELEEKKPPKCAELEITEPSKNAPKPAPKKVLPPFPRERDT